MTNTPIQSDEELINFVRQKIQEPIEEVRKGAVEWHLECENDIKSSGEIMGDGKEEIRRPEAYMVNVIVSMIKAYSQQQALEARIDELKKLQMQSIYIEKVHDKLDRVVITRRNQLVSQLTNHKEKL